MWQYYALGSNRLTGGAAVLTLGRKTAAMLSYLALEGATSRSKLAGLLWPDSEEATARNNLSQTLRRLRALTGEGLITPGDELSLVPELTVDAANLRAAALSGSADEVSRYDGELLATFDYDDLPEFGEWLYGTREALQALRDEALLTLIVTSETQGELGTALKYAERLLGSDPATRTCSLRRRRGWPAPASPLRPGWICRSGSNASSRASCPSSGRTTRCRRCAARTTS